MYVDTHPRSVQWNGVMTLAPLSALDDSLPASRASLSGSTSERGRMYNSREWSNQPRTFTRRYSRSFNSAGLQHINIYIQLIWIRLCDQFWRCGIKIALTHSVGSGIGSAVVNIWRFSISFSFHCLRFTFKYINAINTNRSITTIHSSSVTWGSDWSWSDCTGSRTYPKNTW